MRVKDKTHYSFLLALARQLASALEDDSDDDVAAALVSLGTSLALLLVDEYADAGEDADGDDESIDSDAEPGDEPALGSVLDPKLARRAAALDIANRDVGAPLREPHGGTGVLGRQRRGAAVLNGKGKRRGKK